MSRAKQWFTVLKALGVGAGAMYFLDPDRGKRRRALVRDQVDHATHRISHEVRKRSSDLRNRARGLVYEATSFLQNDLPPSDDILKERVRSASGHAVRHPKQLDLEVNEGVVTLRGSLSGHEHTELVRRIERVPGVRGIRDEISHDGSMNSHPDFTMKAAAGSDGFINPKRLAMAAGVLAVRGLARMMRKSR